MLWANPCSSDAACGAAETVELTEEGARPFEAVALVVSRESICEGRRGVVGPVGECRASRVRDGVGVRVLRHRKTILPV